jgi:hypothetical protein
MLSPSGWPEVPCAGCGKRIAGLDWGGLCAECRARRLGRANRLASRISLPATLLVGLYVTYRMPPLPLARVYGVIAVLVTYIVVRQIVQRVALEFLPLTPHAGGGD